MTRTPRTWACRSACPPGRQTGMATVRRGTRSCAGPAAWPGCRPLLQGGPGHFFAARAADQADPAGMPEPSHRPGPGSFVERDVLADDDLRRIGSPSRWALSATAGRTPRRRKSGMSPGRMRMCAQRDTPRRTCPVQLRARCSFRVAVRRVLHVGRSRAAGGDAACSFPAPAGQR